MSADYGWYKARHICPRCKRTRAADGSVYCAECLAYARASYELTRSQQKALKRKRIAAGLCPQCGGERQDARYRMCEKCRAYHAGYNRRRYHERNEGAKTYDRQS